MKKTNFFRKEFLRRFHENIYEINGKFGIRLRMHHDNTIESIELPEGFFELDQPLEKLIVAINDGIVTVSEQFADELRDTILATMRHMAETGEIPDFDIGQALDEEENDDEDDNDEEDGDTNPTKPKDHNPAS